MDPASHSSCSTLCKRRAALQSRSAAQKKPILSTWPRAALCWLFAKMASWSTCIRLGWAECYQSRCHGCFASIASVVMPLVARCRPLMLQTSHGYDPALRLRLPGLPASFSSEAIPALHSRYIRRFVRLGPAACCSLRYDLVARQPLLIEGLVSQMCRRKSFRVLHAQDTSILAV